MNYKLFFNDDLISNSDWLEKYIYSNDDIITQTESYKKTTEEILDELDLAEIERYVRKKKLERINSVRKSL